MFKKTISLVDEEKNQNCFEEKIDGSIWESQQEIFPSEIEAAEKGWRVDAIKIFLKTTKENA